jgi:tetratricopeptide (TPR) repeat protein
MKRSLVVVALLATSAVGAASAYQAVARQRYYRALLSRGDAALRDDQTFGAIEAYSGAIALRSDSMLAYLRRGETYQRRGDRGDLDAAARDFRKAAALDPSATHPLEALGDVLYQVQRYANAADAFAQCLRLDDRSARVSYKLALSRYRDGDLDAALEAVNQTVRLDDRMADAYYLLGMCLREKHRMSEALSPLEKAVALSPGLIAAREELAEVLAALNRRGDELEQLQVLAVLDRDHVERQVAVGLAHARAGHWDLAVLTLGNALERHPDEPQIYRALGQVWLERPRDDRAFLSKARQALERAAASTNAGSDVLTLYGRALLQEGDVEAAEHTLQQATNRYPIDPAALLFYASAAEKQNHFDAARNALVLYGSVVADDRDFTSRAARIAALSLRLNDPDTAVDWLDQASSASPNDLRLLALLADAQLRAGDAEAAHASIERGLARDPTNATLRNLKLRTDTLNPKL